MSFDSFFRSYLDTALWSSAGGDDEYLDAKYSSGDFAARTRKHLEKDAKDFYEKNEHLWSGKTPGRSSGDERAMTMAATRGTPRKLLAISKANQAFMSTALLFGYQR